MSGNQKQQQFCFKRKKKTTLAAQLFGFEFSCFHTVLLWHSLMAWYLLRVAEMRQRKESNYNRSAINSVTHHQNNIKCIPVNQGWEHWVMVCFLPPGRWGHFLWGERAAEVLAGRGWKSNTQAEGTLSELLASQSCISRGWLLSDDLESHLGPDTASIHPSLPPHTPSCMESGSLWILKPTQFMENGVTLILSALSLIYDLVWFYSSVWPDHIPSFLMRKKQWEPTVNFLPAHYCFLFVCLLFGAPNFMAYRNSQARGWVRAIAAGLCYSHSNVGSEPHLRPTPQVKAMLDPRTTEWGQGSKLHPHGC